MVVPKRHTGSAGAMEPELVVNHHLADFENLDVRHPDGSASAHLQNLPMGFGMSALTKSLGLADDDRCE